MTDILIIGAGPAGLTAAIYALRAGLQVIVFDKGFYGGQVAITAEVENYPAVSRITGPEFAQNIYEQAVALGADIRMEAVEQLQLTGPVKSVVTGEGTYEARTVIIANGAKRRKLGCEGEERLLGRGVSYCATCDGAFFRGKEVAIVGGGNTALEDALYLANVCSRVHLIHRRGDFRGEKALAEAVIARETIDIHYHHAVERIEGETSVTAVVIQDTRTGVAHTLPVSAVFIAIGYEPDTALFAQALPLDETGYIVADESCRTPLSGVYAAGDCRTKILRQIITAAADGAVAAYQAASLLNSGEAGEIRLR